MEVIFLPIAQMEIDDAFDWYEKQAIGLGYDLLDALNDTLRLAVSYPELHPLAGDNIRRFDLHQCLTMKNIYHWYLLVNML